MKGETEQSNKLACGYIRATVPHATSNKWQDQQTMIYFQLLKQTDYSENQRGTIARPFWITSLYLYPFPGAASGNRSPELLKAISRRLTILRRLPLIIQIINWIILDEPWQYTTHLHEIFLWITDHSRTENSQWGGVIEGNWIVNGLSHERVLVQGKTCDWMVTHV